MKIHDHDDHSGDWKRLAWLLERTAPELNGQRDLGAQIERAQRKTIALVLEVAQDVLPHHQYVELVRGMKRAVKEGDGAELRFAHEPEAGEGIG